MTFFQQINYFYIDTLHVTIVYISDDIGLGPFFEKKKVDRNLFFEFLRRYQVFYNLVLYIESLSKILLLLNVIKIVLSGFIFVKLASVHTSFE